MKVKAGQSIIVDAQGNPTRLKGAALKNAKAFLTGWKGANSEDLSDWEFLPTEINQLLRNDLRKLRSRSRDLARNDDTCRRFLALLKQNVLGHTGITLQIKNKLRKGKLDKTFNEIVEVEWSKFCKKRRRRGKSSSPSMCGQMTMTEIAWLSLWNRAIDGESFIQILKGYPHNEHRFALRFLNPDLLDASYSAILDGGNRVEMGIEFDEFDRAVAYHFSENHPNKRAIDYGKRIRIPADQIIHDFRREFVGQIRGIPDFAGIMHKAKMLNGVHEAIVVGWRVAASKMGFFKASDPETEFDSGKYNEFDETLIDATPGSFEKLPEGVDLETFDPDYPTSTYESGHKVFMQQLSNGLNVSSPTLSNDYSGVNYSSLRQALLEDREGWRCIQASMINGFYQPIFDEWYDWSINITRTIKLPATKRDQEPVVVWQPRGWAWVDPLKEVKAHVEAVNAHLRTRQSIIAESSGADFNETVEQLSEEKKAIDDHDLATPSKIEADEEEQE